MSEMDELCRVTAGVGRDEALRLLIAACEARLATQTNPPDLSSWLFASGSTMNWAAQDAAVRHLQFDELRMLLSDPLTEDQASALIGLGFGTEEMEEVLAWLRQGNPSRAEYFIASATEASELAEAGSADPSQGYWLDFKSPGKFSHSFGGASPVPAGDCINCEKPLLHFLSLDTSDERLNLGGLPVPHLPLLYCWTCEAQGDFVYRVDPVSGVEVLDQGMGERLEDFPYENYPEQFPGFSVDLRAISASDQRIIRRIVHSRTAHLTDDMRHLRDAKHQIGGEPFLWQPMRSDMECPVCSAEMPFLATICDNATGPDVRNNYRTEMSFTRNIGVQVVYHCCRRCSVVGAYQICD